MIVSFLLAGCAIHQHRAHHDLSLSLKEESYEDLLTTPLPSGKPEISCPKKIAPPAPAPQEMMKPVSLVLTDKLPLRDVLMELAKQTQVSVVLDPALEGAVMLQAHHKPFLHVLNQLCALSKIRYHMEEGILYIEKDTPYLKTYNLQCLNLVRHNTSKTSIATDIFTSENPEGKKFQGDNGSTTFIQGETKSSFWEEVENNLKMILEEIKENGNTPHYSFHKQAGLLIVKAPWGVHQKLNAYLKLLKQTLASQVLIEAKIVEVSLSDKFQSGINWQSFKGDFQLGASLGDFASPVEPGKQRIHPIPATRDVLALGASGTTLNAIMSFLNTFGTVRTLSSPRITARHNDVAMIKVATHAVFFQVDYNRELGNSNRPETERAQSRIQTVPIGLVMVVLPSINAETGRVSLHLKPTISRVMSFKEDPAVRILTRNTGTSQIPEVQVRELETVVDVEPGKIIVLGGLMEESSNNGASGIPTLRHVPFFGAFAGGKSDDRSINELVILLRVTLLKDDEDSFSPADQRIYETFTKDPRPLVFPAPHPQKENPLQPVVTP